ncbi:probable tyrosine-protein kinase transforming protein Src [Coccomyxa sp. Obi]|nr:probable tyrosine-protein kinase transforming protein Src [Coccomyxa sp. Obi]
MSRFEVFLDDHYNPVTSPQGPLGQVWKARMDDQTVVALQTAYFDVQKARLFSREMTGLLGLDRHRCVLQLYGVVYTGWDTLLVLEYAPGPSLMDAMQSFDKSQQLSWIGQSGQSIALDMASALCHLHKCNAVLSELNPILTEDLTHAKVVGFNLEHIGRTPPFRKRSASPGHIPRHCKDWIAPEVYSNQKISMKADVFSFGAILFEMVVQEYVDMHAQGIKPKVPQQCSQEVFDLIEACLNAHPEARPTSEDVFRVLSSLVPVA